MKVLLVSRTNQNLLTNKHFPAEVFFSNEDIPSGALQRFLEEKFVLECVSTGYICLRIEKISLRKAPNLFRFCCFCTLGLIGDSKVSVKAKICL